MTNESIRDVVKVENLGFAYRRKTILEEISFEIERGSTFGILGRNAAGKTTLLKVLTGLLPSMSGKVSLFGHDVHESFDRVRGRFGFVAEETQSVRPSWKGIEYLEYMARVWRLPDDVFKERLHEMCKIADLSPVALNQTIETLSAGNRKKVEILRAILPHPELLFLDEPTKELDPVSRRNVWNLLRTLVDEQRMTVFLCSHDITEVEVLCDTIVILSDGRVSYSGSVPETSLHLDVHCPQEVQEDILKSFRNTDFSSRIKGVGTLLTFHSLKPNEIHRIITVLNEVAPEASIDIRTSDFLENLEQYL
jgi:ABC-2 type transport system ATP-binding protein